MADPPVSLDRVLVWIALEIGISYTSSCVAALLPANGDRKSWILSAPASASRRLSSSTGTHQVLQLVDQCMVSRAQCRNAIELFSLIFDNKLVKI